MQEFMLRGGPSFLKARAHLVICSFAPSERDDTASKPRISPEDSNAGERFCLCTTPLCIFKPTKEHFPNTYFSHTHTHIHNTHKHRHIYLHIYTLTDRNLGPSTALSRMCRPTKQTAQSPYFWNCHTNIGLDAHKGCTAVCKHIHACDVIMGFQS